MGLGRAAHVVERNLIVSRHVWLALVGGGLEPVFYLFAVGVGIGQLVGDVGAGGTAVSYAAFVAPGLLAASAMNGAVTEAGNVFFRVRYAKTYVAMLATPMAPRDVAVGEIAFSQLRGLIYGLGFLLVMVALGLVHSPLGVLVVPAVVLVGVAFGAVGMAGATYMRSYLDYDLFQLALLPLFLFSATFFPIDVFPAEIRWVVQLSPLYHAVALIRGLTLGTIGAGAVVHIVYLAVMTAVGLRVASRRLQGLLLR